MSAKQKTCADKVNAACESRLEDIRSMLALERDDITLGDDGTVDTVIYPGSLDSIRYDDTSAYRDQSGALDMESFLDDEYDNIREYCYERFFEYGLSFDYVAPNTFEDQPEGYIRYLISWGGPSEEIRFYVSPYGTQWGMNSWALHRAEFWYLDWFDGACVDVTHDDRARMVFEHFDGCGSVDHAIREANDNE